MPCQQVLLCRVYHQLSGCQTAGHAGRPAGGASTTAGRWRAGHAGLLRSRCRYLGCHTLTALACSICKAHVHGWCMPRSSLCRTVLVAICVLLNGCARPSLPPQQLAVVQWVHCKACFLLAQTHACSNDSPTVCTMPRRWGGWGPSVFFMLKAAGFVLGPRSTGILAADGAMHLWRGAAAECAGPVMDVYVQLETLLGSLNLPPDAPICLARQVRTAWQASLILRGPAVCAAGDAARQPQPAAGCAHLPREGRWARHCRLH